jgi:hypothetical protein
MMRTRRLRERLHVFVQTFQWYGYSDNSMFADDAPLKNASASWSFCRVSREPLISSHQNGGFAATQR